MDEKSQDYLNKILAKEPGSLSESEIGFLRARSSYLKKSQLEEYDGVLEPEEAPLYVAEKDRKNQTPKGTVKQDANPE